MPMTSVKRFSLRSTKLAASVTLAGALCLGATVSSCQRFFSPGPSNVAQGLHYNPGSPEFDRFFDSMYRAQLKMGTAPQDEQAIRKQLARSLGGEGKVDPTELGQLTAEHADRLAKAGTALSLTLSGMDAPDAMPSAKIESSGLPTGNSDKNIITAIGTAAQAEAKMLGEMRQVKVASERLREDAAALEPGIDKAFRGMTMRAEVTKNLKDAQALIPLMIQRADEVEALAKLTLDQLVRSANTSDQVAAQRESTETPKIVLEEDKPEKPVRKSAPRSGGSAPATAHPAPKPAASPPPKAPPPPPTGPQDDFQP